MTLPQMTLFQSKQPCHSSSMKLLCSSGWTLPSGIGWALGHTAWSVRVGSGTQGTERVISLMASIFSEILGKNHTQRVFWILSEVLDLTRTVHPSNTAGFTRMSSILDQRNIVPPQMTLTISKNSDLMLRLLGLIHIGFPPLTVFLCSTRKTVSGGVPYPPAKGLQTILCPPQFPPLKKRYREPKHLSIRWKYLFWFIVYV